MITFQNVLPSQALRFTGGERLPECLRELALPTGGGALVDGSATLADVTVLDWTGAQKRLPHAEAIRLTGSVCGTDIELHGLFYADARMISGRLVTAVALAGQVRVDSFKTTNKASQPSSEGTRQIRALATSSPTEPDWADLAASSADVERELVVLEAELRWADVAAVSEAASTQRAPRSKVALPPKQALTHATQKLAALPNDDEIELGRGAWVQHKQFGLCQIERLLPDSGAVLRMQNGRRKDVKLDFFEAKGPKRDSAGRDVYDLEPRKRS